MLVTRLIRANDPRFSRSGASAASGAVGWKRLLAVPAGPAGVLGGGHYDQATRA